MSVAPTRTTGHGKGAPLQERRCAGKPESAEEQHRRATIAAALVAGKSFFRAQHEHRILYVSDHTERIGMNEALFREVNEQIEKLQDDLGAPGTFAIVCECGRTDCMERFPITNEGYRELRSDGLQFAVIPGHELLEVEKVIATRDAYIIVVKTDPDAAAAAEETA